MDFGQKKKINLRLGLATFLIIAVMVIVLDQATKIIVVGNFNLGDSVPLIPGIFHLTYVRNPGAAFGILAERTTFFIVITVIMIVLIMYGRSLFSTRHVFIHLALALQLGGAMGNFIDRIRFGYVIDFIDFQIWPVFNIADIAIVAGMIFLLISLFKNTAFIQERKG